MKSLKDRHAEACELKQEISHERIAGCLSRHREALGLKPKNNKKYSSFIEFVSDLGDNYLFDASYDSIIAIGAEQKEMKKELGIYLPILEAFEAGLWLYFFSNGGICYLPIPKIYMNASKQLHRVDGPAIETDEDGRYYLNGVAVAKSLVMTPAEKLDPKMIFAEKNAETRREIVRKIGMERIVLKCGAKSIDKQGGYELMEFDIGDNLKRPYLKMQNPSIGIWHIEGVGPGIKTVDAALEFRKPPALRAIPIDDEAGEEFFQQGDVFIWPENAKSVRRYPSILT